MLRMIAGCVAYRVDEALVLDGRIEERVGDAEHALRHLGQVDVGAVGRIAECEVMRRVHDGERGGRLTLVAAPPAAGRQYRVQIGMWIGACRIAGGVGA